MTAEKILELTTQLFNYTHEYGQEYTNKIIQNPSEYTKSLRVSESIFAQLVKGLKDDIVAKSEKAKGSSSARITAIKKFVNAAVKRGYEIMSGLFQNEKGEWTIIDGYRIYKLKDDIPELPHIAENVKKFKVYPILEPAREYPISVELPSIADIKVFAAATKGTRKPFILKNDNIEIGINPTYLLEAMQFTGADKAYCNNPRMPLYFKNADGSEEAVVLPINISKPE